jgi:ubiquinone/menaquinone biosynthesis C-methylase UbiE
MLFEKQYLKCVINGVKFKFYDKKVLEIGCGQGGISTYFSVAGAKEVIGIDLNTYHLNIANKFKQKIEKDLNRQNELNLKFLEMNAYDMKFEPGSFDVIIADNVFEHFMDTKLVLEQSFKLLKSGGVLVVPNFNSIYSKYGLHLKNGIKMPWANLIFSEKTICEAMQMLAKKDPSILKAYPGLINNPKKVKDLREYGDLNSMTHKRFVREVKESGFKLDYFGINPISKSIFKELLRVIFTRKLFRTTRLADIITMNASAMLFKP